MKKIFTLIAAMLLMMAPWVGWGQGFSGGTGTENDPYLISNSDDLKSLAESVNNGEPYKGKYFELTQDIDLEGNEEKQWTPIDDFEGTFDGKGYPVEHFFISKTLS